MTGTLHCIKYTFLNIITHLSVSTQYYLRPTTNRSWNSCNMPENITDDRYCSVIYMTCFDIIALTIFSFFVSRLMRQWQTHTFMKGNFSFCDLYVIVVQHSYIDWLQFYLLNILISAIETVHQNRRSLMQTGKLALGKTYLVLRNQM